MIDVKKHIGGLQKFQSKGRYDEYFWTGKSSDSSDSGASEKLEVSMRRARKIEKLWPPRKEK